MLCKARSVALPGLSPWACRTLGSLHVCPAQPLSAVPHTCVAQLHPELSKMRVETALHLLVPGGTWDDRDAALLPASLPVQCRHPHLHRAPCPGPCGLCHTRGRGAARRAHEPMCSKQTALWGGMNADSPAALGRWDAMGAGQDTAKAWARQGCQYKGRARGSITGYLDVRTEGAGGAALREHRNMELQAGMLKHLETWVGSVVTADRVSV